MGLFRKMADYVRRLSLRDADGWPVENPSDSGEMVTAASVLALSTAWACVNLLSGTQSSLPLMVYRTGKNGEREVARDHPLYRILHDSPNADQTAVDFWDAGTAAIELRGNMYARISRTGRKVVALTPIETEVQTYWRSDRTIGYRWSADGRSYDEGQADIFHVRGFGGHPLGGLSTIAYGRQVFGLASAVNRSAASTFRNGLRPSGVLMVPKFMTPEQRQVARDNLQEKFLGAMNSGRPMVLEGGMTWEALGINPEDAQLLQSRGFSVEEVCRFFGVPPFMIGHTEKSTSWGTGLEQQTLGFQKFTLRRRLKRIEQAIEKQLLTTDDRAAGVVVEFNLEGLLRGDTATRFSSYAIGLQNGFYTINEVRRLQNMTPVEGGDVPRMQMQNVPITQVGQPVATTPAA